MAIFIAFFRRLARRLSRSDLAAVGALAVLLIVLGTFAYARFEGWGWLDALYATVITITTVGYGDLTPSTADGRLFAIFFTFIAIGVVGYTISTLAANLVEGRAHKRAKYLGKRRMKRIDALKNHYILCGADMVGIRIADEFYQAGVPFIIVEPDETRLKHALLFTHPDYFQQKVRAFMDIEEIDLSQYEERSVAELGELLATPYIQEDPTDDAALVKAGIDRAQGLVAAMPDERDNLSIIVGARGLAKRAGNSALRIMARVDGANMKRKMYLSGADAVRMPAMMSGYEMATHIMNPEIGEWWYTLAGVDKGDAPRIRQIDLQTKPNWIGRTVVDLHRDLELVTLAVKRGDTFLSPPAAGLALEAEDILISLSRRER